MSDGGVRHEHDYHPGWHLPVQAMRSDVWTGKPTLHLRAGLVRGRGALEAYALLPTAGEFPHVATIIKARWAVERLTPMALVAAACDSLWLWLEEYDQP